MIAVSPWWDEGFIAPDGARNPYTPGTMSYMDWNIGFLASGRQPKARRHPCPMNCIRLTDIIDRLACLNHWVDWQIDEHGRVMANLHGTGKFTCIWAFSKEFQAKCL